jgi:heat shock protein HslJ
MEETMKSTRTTLVDAILILTLLLAACTNANQEQPTAPSAALPGTGWVLVSLNGSAPLAGKEITLRFEEASVGGSAGCNTYGGSYTVSEDRLRLSGVYATEMACMQPAGIMEQEQAYLSALNAAARFQVDGGRLQIYDGGGTQILAFVAAGE